MLGSQLYVGYHQYTSPCLYPKYKSDYENWHLNIGGINALAKNYLVL